jgi:hypothetical protein
LVCVCVGGGGSRVWWSCRVAFDRSLTQAHVLHTCGARTFRLWNACGEAGGVRTKAAAEAALFAAFVLAEVCRYNCSFPSLREYPPDFAELFVCAGKAAARAELRRRGNLADVDVPLVRQETGNHQGSRECD